MKNSRGKRAVLSLTLGLGLGACIAAPPVQPTTGVPTTTAAPTTTAPTATTTPASTTTTTTPGPWGAAAGCYTYIGMWDMKYNGVKNSYGNALYMLSNTGSCSGGVDTGVLANTLVEASSQSQADALCHSIGGTTGPAFQITGAAEFVPTFPVANAWVCVA